MPKKTTLKSAKARAWKEFSLFIKARDSIDGFFVCCSCGEMKPVDKGQAGHFIPGRLNAVLYEENGVHLQCIKCNGFLQGNWPGYYQFMLDKYGQIEIDRQIAASKKIVQLKMHDHLEIERRYKDKLKDLINS